ncbi:hypothetical protein BJ508DRAFT_325291 [Ascobolus immersus RN42]|uniref:Uncharacterized protein n=1 Tax=Ascobolus immersus RN42 TaxID=1160509 RepID=A0A3N4ICY3_ASCIM|nr:hypothetical protein BJ508DRAFT_325291 [Ascobolus immersus RN42]
MSARPLSRRSSLGVGLDVSLTSKLEFLSRCRPRCQLDLQVREPLSVSASMSARSPCRKPEALPRCRLVLQVTSRRSSLDVDSSSKSQVGGPPSMSTRPPSHKSEILPRFRLALHVRTPPRCRRPPILVDVDRLVLHIRSSLNVGLCLMSVCPQARTRILSSSCYQILPRCRSTVVVGFSLYAGSSMSTTLSKSASGEVRSGVKEEGETGTR